MSRVFVVNEHFKISDAGEVIPVHDLSAARKYGELVYLLKHGTMPYDMSRVIPPLQKGLQSYSDDDFILLVGAPIALGLATAIAANANNGRLKFLRWRPYEGNYSVVEANLFALDAARMAG